jgi:formylglycine-generating enzyme required for sulfatase activity
VCSATCQWGGYGPELTPLARIPKPDGSGTYGIEQYEVTREQYAQFLRAPAAEIASALGTPRDGCTQQPSYQPDSVCMTGSTVCTTSCSRDPQVCVDWCDAYAYCKWVGRRLCGKIGGGPSDITQYNSLLTSQWTVACVGNQGTFDVFPYGAKPQNDVCNDASNGCSASADACITMGVGEARSCHGISDPYSTVFDMSGNVAEWEDVCVLVDPTHQTIRCQTRGGSFEDYPDPTTTSLKCSGSITDRSDVHAALPYVGFRCCAD